MDFYDDLEFDGYDDELAYEEDGFDFEEPAKGAAKPVTKKKKELAKAAVKTISRVASKAEGLPPATANRKAAIEAQKAVAKVEQELFEGDFEADDELDFELDGLIDPELLEEMQEMADLAAEADDEMEADEFLGALGALAAKAAPMLLQAAPGIISSFLGEEEYEGGFDLEGDEFMDEEGDEFLGAIAGLASAALPSIVKGVGKMLRRRGAPRVIRRLPSAVLRAAQRTARSRRPSPGTFVRHLGVQTARAVLNPYGYRGSRRRRTRRYPTYGYGRRYRTVCRRVPTRRPYGYRPRYR